MRVVVIALLLMLNAGLCRAQSQPADSLNNKKLYTAIGVQTAFYVAGMSYLQFVWYRDKERVPFHYYNDAAGFQQIDKLGHAFGAYVGSYVGYHWLRSAGLSRNKSLLFGGSLGLVLLTPIEVFDGLYEGWGFSWPDMAANAAGAGLVVGNELLFGKQLVKYKFSFAPSPYREQAQGYLGETALNSLFLDYNAHTYWLSVPLNKILPGTNLPSWISLAAGYSANGMFGEFHNRTQYRGLQIPTTERYRQFLLSPDIDWTRIPTNSRFLKTLFQAMFFVKLPAPALEITNNGSWKLYGLYY